MVNLNVIDVAVYTNSIVPSLLVSINAKISANAIPINMSASLYSEDNKFLSFSQPFINCNIPPRGETNGEQVSISDIDPQQSKEVDFYYQLVFQLSEKALNYIEKSRKINPDGDVVFNFSLSIDFVEIWISVGYFAEYKIPGSNPEQSAVVKSRRENSNQNLNILIERNGPSFISHHFKIKKSYKIPSSYWIKHYLPELGLGRYFTVEIPEGKGSLSHAWEILNEAEEAFRRWDAVAVMDKCRQVGQYLDGQIKKKFGKDSFTYNERWGRIRGGGIKGFLGWTSFALHKEDIKNSGTEGRNYSEDEIKVTSSDAEAALFFTKLLIKYCEELLREKS